MIIGSCKADQGRTYSPPASGRWVSAPSEGDAPAGSCPTCSTEAGGRQGIGYALPTAPLTVSSFSALWQPRGAYAPLFQNVFFFGNNPLTNRLLIWNAKTMPPHYFSQSSALCGRRAFLHIKARGMLIMGSKKLRELKKETRSATKHSSNAFGDPPEIRTPDHRIKSAVLYLLS